MCDPNTANGENGISDKFDCAGVVTFRRHMRSCPIGGRNTHEAVASSHVFIAAARGTCNPAAAVRGPKHVVKKGKTPVLDGDGAKKLLDSIDVSTVDGLHDRALIALLVYTFARVSAALHTNVEDYYPQGTLAGPLPQAARNAGAPKPSKMIRDPSTICKNRRDRAAASRHRTTDHGTERWPHWSDLDSTNGLAAVDNERVPDHKTCKRAEIKNFDEATFS